MLAFLGLWNVVVFILYAFDKWKAVQHGCRISERTLLTCSLLAGGFGGLVAMLLFRHKTRKMIFYFVNITGIIVLLGSLIYMTYYIV